MERLKIMSVEDIKKPKNKVFERTTYDLNGISLENKDVKLKKENFINFVLPSIIAVKEDIKKEKEKVVKILSFEKKNEENEKYLKKTYEKYKVEEGNVNELLKRMNTVPVELALAQAIIESGWGTSRFSKYGNNIYGIWSFNKNEKRIKASEGVRGGKPVYLRKYDYIYECVHDYFYSLSVGINYEQLREELKETDDGLKLSEFLDGYSEIREEYIGRVKSIIKYNDLVKYKEYELK
jgi:Bax protein